MLLLLTSWIEGKQQLTKIALDLIFPSRSFVDWHQLTTINFPQNFMTSVAKDWSLAYFNRSNPDMSVFIRVTNAWDAPLGHLLGSIWSHTVFKMAAKNELLEYNTHKKNIKRERKKVKKKKKRNKQPSPKQKNSPLDSILDWSEPGLRGAHVNPIRATQERCMPSWTLEKAGNQTSNDMLQPQSLQFSRK